MAVDWDHLVIGPTTHIFGDRVAFQSRQFGCFEVNGVFDEAYLQLEPMGGGSEGAESFNIGSPGNITTVQPTLGIRVSEFRHYPQQSDTLTILTGTHAGQRFEVREVRPDGHGAARLTLNEYMGI